MILQKQDVESSMASGSGPAAPLAEHCNIFWGLGEFFYQLSDHYFLEKDSAPWNLVKFINSHRRRRGTDRN
jgi:hypothetical protein